jgi:hypothetical protein
LFKKMYHKKYIIHQFESKIKEKFKPKQKYKPEGKAKFPY